MSSNVTEPTSGSAAADSERRYLGLTRRQAAMVLLFIAPVLFATNMLVARGTHDLVPPVALAFWRWVVTFLLLLPFAGAALWRERKIALAEPADPGRTRHGRLRRLRLRRRRHH